VIPCEEDKAGHHPVTPALHFSRIWSTFHGERSTQEIMINVIIHHEVADYMAWKAAFDSSLDLAAQERRTRLPHFSQRRKRQRPHPFLRMGKSGVGARLHRVPELKTKMAGAGVKGAPRVDFLTEVHSVRRSAAD